jgi:glyoxylase-like metal-dependent hydrolase (beta-lactamase superfamily II)
VNYKIEDISDDLFLITLNPPLRGFEDFICAWLYRGEVTFLVDVGPSSTARGLLHALRDINLNHLDFILLTHIHLDHAGAIGEIAAHFPQTPIVCHPAGIPHLVDPTRLWQGTKKVLGSLADGYGPIQGISMHQSLDAEKFSSEVIVPVITPGHALHHVSYWTKKYLFIGEACGVHYSAGQGRFCSRPATPPRFFFDTYLESLEKLTPFRTNKLCLGHYGLADDSAKVLENHFRQIFLWEKIINEEIERASAENLIEICLARLLMEDPLLRHFSNLTKETQDREKYFIKNSINGFVGYLEGDQ